MKHLTISIPAYNDEKSIVRLVEDIFSIKSSLPSFEILIINDGSSDNTLDTIRFLQSTYPEISIISHEKNLGFGPTITEVVKVPKTEWIMFLSGDNQFPATNILKFLKYRNEADFILGYRKGRMDNWSRRLNSLVYNKLIELSTGKKIKDINSIFLCKSSIFEDVCFFSKSAFIHAEIVLTALQKEVKFKLIDIEHHTRKHGIGSGGKLRIILPTVWDFLKYLYRGIS